MNGPSSPQLRYQLYSDAARTTPWGSWPAALYGGGFTWDVFSTGPNLSATTTVHGRVLANQQTIPSGSYSSTLTLFFTYQKDDKKACPDPGEGNSSTSFSATATVLASCAVSATNLDFGTTGTLTSNIDSTSSIKVSCTNGSPYQIGLDAGTGTGATVTNRKMTLSGATVNYALYSNSSRTTNWGNTVGTDTVGGTGTGASQLLTVYGRVPSQSTPAPGTYTDTIVVTVTY
jgi:spore coat protein U-like protein